MPRRELHIENFDQVRDEVVRLLRDGYSPSGKWNLAQTCFHLDCWMGYSMDGYPPSPVLLRPVFWCVKKLIGKKMLLKIIHEGKMREGVPTAPPTVATRDQQEDQVAADLFLATLDRFTKFAGDVHPSPLFGPMTLEQARQLQLVHCRHHLSFLDLPSK